MKILIMRGIPGSGKTTSVRRWLDSRLTLHDEQWSECSADTYRMVSGVYKSDPVSLVTGHKMCLTRYTEIISRNPSQLTGLVVDNTNTSAWEIAPYYALAEAIGHEPLIVHVDCPFQQACQRNVHNVPHGTVWRMCQNLLTERLPPHWKEVFLFNDADITTDLIK